MILGLELFGAFVAGVVFALVMLAVLIPKLGPRLIRWQVSKAMGAQAKGRVDSVLPGDFLRGVEERMRDQGGLK